MVVHLYILHEDDKAPVGPIFSTFSTDIRLVIPSFVVLLAEG